MWAGIMSRCSWVKSLVLTGRSSSSPSVSFTVFCAVRGTDPAIGDHLRPRPTLKGDGADVVVVGVGHGPHGHPPPGLGGRRHTQQFGAHLCRRPLRERRALRCETAKAMCPAAFSGWAPRWSAPRDPAWPSNRHRGLRGWPQGVAVVLGEWQGPVLSTQVLGVIAHWRKI